jgi:hypothetical protein
MRFELDYFAGAAGVLDAAGVAGVAAVLLVAVFLVFFTCFLATGAELSAGAGVAWPASDSPAVASVRENPSNTAVIFVMVFCPIPFLRGPLFSASESIDEGSINRT